MLMFIPSYMILCLIRFFVITKYTVLDEQQHEDRGESQCQNPRGITGGANHALVPYNIQRHCSIYIVMMFFYLILVAVPPVSR